MNNASTKQDVSIQHYAFGVRELTSVDFDKHNKAQLHATLVELEKIAGIKKLVVSRGCDFRTDAHYDAFALTKSALDVLVSALQMARQRAGVEAYSLLRVALECGATALHITGDSGAYEDYKRNDYHSTKAIGFAKKSIPILGEVWGAFSQRAVHVNWICFGPKIKPDGKGDFIRSVTLEYKCREHRPLQDQIMLTSISLVAVIILKITELLLFEKSQIYEGALQLVGTQTLYMANTDSQLLKYDKELQSYVPR